MRSSRPTGIQRDHPIRVRPVNPVVRSHPPTSSRKDPAPACRATRAPSVVNSHRPRARPFDLVNLLGVRQRDDPDARQNVRRRAVAGVTDHGLNPRERMGPSDAARPHPDWQPPRQGVHRCEAASLEAARSVTPGRLGPGEDSGFEDVTAHVAPRGRPNQRRGGHNS